MVTTITEAILKLTCRFPSIWYKSKNFHLSAKENLKINMKHTNYKVNLDEYPPRNALPHVHLKCTIGEEIGWRCEYSISFFLRADI